MPLPKPIDDNHPLEFKLQSRDIQMNYRSCSCSSSFFLPGLAVALSGGFGGCVGVRKRNCKLEYESYDALSTHPNSSGKYYRSAFLAVCSTRKSRKSKTAESIN